jgi:hypothetical protein
VDWVRIESPDHYTGWVAEADLAPAPETPYASSGKVVRVASLFANIYGQPDITVRRPLVTVPFESPLEVVAEPEDEERRWIEVRLPDNRRAWIQRGDVTFDTEPLTIPETIELARRFIGLPYLWGGTSTFGFDCSGFTQMLCRRRGILIPRDARPQAAWEGMEEIAPGSLRPGDLLFFGENPDKISHTGMYIGGGEFIHATVYLEPRVQVSRLDDPHWTGLLVACRRPGEAK